MSNKVSVIISTYTKERIDDVNRCLNSLNNQTLKPEEVLLVLDPEDSLVKFYRRNVLRDFDFDFRIVKSPKPGLSNARNTGVENSSCEIVAFIDDDAWADRLWLENMVQNYSSWDVWGVGGKIVPVFEKNRPGWLAEELDWVVGCTYKGMPEKRAEIRNPIGANMSFRRKAFEKVGFFSCSVGRYGKKLLSGEETEFAMRLKKMMRLKKKLDVRIVYDPSAVVYHRVPAERTKISYVLKRAYYEGYSKAVLSKEYPLKNEYSYMSFLLKKSIRRITELKFAEIAGILLVIVCAGLGNLVGRMKA